MLRRREYFSIGDTVKKPTDELKNVANGLKDEINNTANAAKNEITGAAAAAKNEITSAVATAKREVLAAAESAKSELTKGGAFFKNVLWEGIKGAVKSVIDWLLSFGRWALGVAATSSCLCVVCLCWFCGCIPAMIQGFRTVWNYVT